MSDPLDVVRTALDEARGGVQLVTASSIRPRQVRWAWHQRIPLGGPTVVAGNGSMGKTSLLMELAARWSRGQLEGDLEGEPVTVVIATAEDDPATTLVPRLLAAGTDLERVAFVQVGRDGLAGNITLPDDTDALAAKMREMAARVLVIDPLVAHLPNSINSWRDQDIRRAMAPLAQLAQELEAAVVTIVHLNKSASSDVLGRISGSIGIANAARSVILVAPPPNAPEGSERVLVVPKANLGPTPAALRFRIESRTVAGWAAEEIATAGVVWLGEALGVNAEDLLSNLDSEERTERDEAAEWLREALADGARPGKDCLAEARKAGISERTLRRAKAALGVRSVKRGGAFGGDPGWAWTLPEGGHEGPEGGQYLERGNLQPHAGSISQVKPEDGHLFGIGSLPSRDGSLQDPRVDTERNGCPDCGGHAGHTLQCPRSSLIS